ncbi:CHAT domain-containing protein [Streptomyces sp. LS1784]|uniref:CHAT domain-containing protein n=1 Tax=Streptomyces sp. LS1784 TaxID=2851533 RepID=UPI001CC936FC|nr:CHAT domain-containing protein [Streptomyces sp. LS1784]
MAVSTRAPYAWNCPECARGCQEPVWHIIDARERADVLEVDGPGVSWVACPGCGARAHIDAPVLVLRPDAIVQVLFASSVEDLQAGAGDCATRILAEAGRAGAFDGGTITGQTIPLPRRALPVVLARDVDRDLDDPETARRELLREGPPTVANYEIFLEFARAEREAARVRYLLRAVMGTLPGAFAELVRNNPELTTSTQVRDAAREELRAAAGTPMETLLGARQRLLDGLCRSDPPQDEVIRRYFGELERLGQGLRERLAVLDRRARETRGAEGVRAAREALELARQTGDAALETELAALLGSRLLDVVHDGLDTDPSEAIGLLEHALSHLPEGSLAWAQVASNLASGHDRRQDGDLVENWLTARDLLARAAELDHDLHPDTWAVIQTNYGLLLASRPGGGPEDLDLGIDRLLLGLRARSPERNAVDWAYSMLNLGMLLFRRGRPEDLIQAEQRYRSALAHLPPDHHPRLWAQLQCNLADLLLSREPADALGARAAVSAALDLAAARPGLVDSARVKWLLARCHDRLDRHDRLDGPGSAEGLRLRREALLAAPPTVSPSLHLGIGTEVLTVLADAGRWTEAADLVAGLLTALDALYDAQVTAPGRQDVLTRWPLLARFAAYLLARAGRPEQAVEAIERGLARELSVVTGRGAVELAALERIDPALAGRYRQAQSRYRRAAAEPAAATPHGLDPGTAEQADAERGLRTVIAEIRRIPGMERFLSTSGLEDIVRAAAGRPLAYLVYAPWGSCVLTIPRVQDRTPLPPGAGGKLPQVEARPRVLGTVVPEVSGATVLSLLILDPEDEHAPGVLLTQHAGALRRRKDLPAALERLGLLEPLLRPVARLLAEDPRHEAVVIPTGLLGMVPLHAVPVGPGPAGVLDDVGTLYVSPSAAVHAACGARAARPPEAAQLLVAVGDPDGSLPGSRVELDAVVGVFEPLGEVHRAMGADATVAWLLDHVAEATVLHLSCHGSADLGSRGASLALADGRLDVEVLARRQLRCCRLVVASACQSGHFEIVRMPDEFVGLPAGFLQAGAACAVTSLWQVDDLATAVLMTRFHELLPRVGADGRDPVRALREARSWLRGLTGAGLAQYTAGRPGLADLARRYAAPAADGQPFASPRRWAGFTAWGA